MVWTREAEKSLDDILDYLESNWTEKEIRKFFISLEHCLSEIQAHSNSQKNSLRKEGTKEYQHSEQATIFYTFDENNVYLLKIWSNRMNPNSLVN